MEFVDGVYTRFLGCSAYEYLTNYRISKAKELLRGRYRMQIQSIAGQVGFEDFSHFIAMFKKQMGVTPYQFRKMWL